MSIPEEFRKSEAVKSTVEAVDESHPFLVVKMVVPSQRAMLERSSWMS